MPTVCEIKMQLKELGVKGLTGKNKAELSQMLYFAQNPVPKVIPQKRQKAPAPEPVPEPEPLPVPVRKRPVMKVRPKRDAEDPLRQLKKVVAEAIEASKEGGLFKRRENWKGKAGFMKKIDQLWDEWTGSSDAFFREVPYHFNWKPKDAEEGDSHAHKMYMKHGVNID